MPIPLFKTKCYQILVSKPFIASVILGVCNISVQFRFTRSQSTMFSCTQHIVLKYIQIRYRIYSTDETLNRLGLWSLCDMYYVFYRLLSTTHFRSWFTNLEQTSRNRSKQLAAPYKLLIDGIKQNWLRENDWTTDNLANNRRLFNCDKRRIETHKRHYESS